MRVYYFASPDDGLAILSSRKLRVSHLNRLNDPFEFSGVDLSNPKNRRALRATKAGLAKSFGLVCFSRTWHNPVLWGHYAKKHQGICLGFDFTWADLHQVAYVTSRFPWPDKPSQSFMMQLFFTKFVHWSYEDEFRAWVNLKKPDKDGEYYIKFSDVLVLRQVMVGSESNLERADIAKALGAPTFGDIPGEMDAFKVRAAFRTFRVVRNKKESMWK